MLLLQLAPTSPPLLLPVACSKQFGASGRS
jgi:hypothetical protein